MKTVPLHQKKYMHLDGKKDEPFSWRIAAIELNVNITSSNEKTMQLCYQLLLLIYS